MDVTAPNSSHVLSGRNLTLLNVVVQYADMDTLRALAVTSDSMYETLQKCHFDHLLVVVLEASFLEEQQRVVYNGADPVPADTFKLPPNDAVPTSTSDSILSNARAFEVWRERSAIYNGFEHNLIIPNYARNFMARAQSVELVVYRPRLGTRVSTFFNNNAHHFKHGQPLVCDDCASCVQKLHLPCSLEQVNGDGSCSSSDNGCIFSKHFSHEYFEGDTAESRHRRFHTPPIQMGSCEQDFPSLKLNTNNTDGSFYQDGHFYIAPRRHNTHIYYPQFQNLPPTVPNVRTVESMIFRVEDWCNAIPGCTIQPLQTWVIHDDPNVPHHHHHLLYHAIDITRWFGYSERPSASH